MAYNSNYYQGAQTQDDDEHQEQQHPVNTGVDSKFQDQTLNQGLHYKHHTYQGVAQETFYDFQQSYSVYNNGFGAPTFQGHPQYGQMMVPFQIPDHKPITITEVIVEEKTPDSAPEVVQVLEETAEKTVTTPDLAPISDYPENLWELVCKFCPAESSVSSVLAQHLCNKSLVEPENEGNIICNSCFSRLPNGMSLEAHKKTRRHLLLLLNYKGEMKIDALHFFYCSTCKVQCSSHVDYTNHMVSKKHLEFNECLPLNLYYCNNCKLTMDITGYEVHLSCKTHLINSMVSNIRLFYLIYNLDTSNLWCKICKTKCTNGKSYKAHQYSVEHCSKLLDIKLKDDFSHSNQYVFFNSNKYWCVLCKLNIADKASLIYHFLTDEHMSCEYHFEKMQYKRFVSGEFYMTAHIKAQYLQCFECKTLQRDCEHMFKNGNEYRIWKKKIENGKYCVYCNCFNDLSHESSELHLKMISTVNYCKACDKVLTINIVEHEQSKHHRQTIERFGVEGVNNKHGPSKLYCGICELNSDKEVHHIDHLEGVNHRKNYNTKCIENRFHCKLCHFTVTDVYQYEEHEKSIEHMKKLNKIEKQFDRLKFCFICSQPITNGTISEHIETVQHHVNKSLLYKVTIC